jgi:hypothetical protein
MVGRTFLSVLFSKGEAADRNVCPTVFHNNGGEPKKPFGLTPIGFFHSTPKRNVRVFLMRLPLISLLLALFVLSGCGGNIEPVNEGKDRPIPREKAQKKDK